MRALVAPPDGAEVRFLLLWVGAWLLGASMAIVLLEGTALIHPPPGAAPLSETETFLLAYGDAIEAILLLAIFVLAPALSWMALSPLYPRGGLGAWLGWMVAGAFVMIVVAGLSVILVYDVETLKMQHGPFGLVVVFLTDLSSKSGYILAFLFLAWRVGVTTAAASAIATLLLMMVGLSSVANDMLSDADPNAGWGQGVALSEVPPLLFETAVLGAATGAAVVVGFRWHTRDVEERIFD